MIMSPEAGCDGGEYLGNQSVEVSVGGGLHSKVVLTQVINSCKEPRSDVCLGHTLHSDNGVCLTIKMYLPWLSTKKATSVCSRAVWVSSTEL